MVGIPDVDVCGIAHEPIDVLRADRGIVLRAETFLLYDDGLEEQCDGGRGRER